VCHADRQAARNRAESRACATCHHASPAQASRVQVTREGQPGMAPGYEKAMHGLCLGCHREEEAAIAVVDRYLSRCATCHRNEYASDGELHRRPPFAVVAAVSGPAATTPGAVEGSP
jgi:hypothetical protein